MSSSLRRLLSFGAAAAGAASSARSGKAARARTVRDKTRGNLSIRCSPLITDGPEAGRAAGVPAVPACVSLYVAMASPEIRVRRGVGSGPGIRLGLRLRHAARFQWRTGALACPLERVCRPAVEAWAGPPRDARDAGCWCQAFGI